MPSPYMHFTEAEKLEMVEMYERGYSATDIANRFNRPAGSIYNVLRAKGVEMRPPNSVSLRDDKVMLAIKLYNQKKPRLKLNEIADVVGITTATLKKYLREAGVEKRPNKQ